MNNKLFSTTPGSVIPPTDTKNEAGGVAYARGPQEALAQLAATGCFGDTFYATAEDQLTKVLDVAKQCTDEWIAKCAVYSRKEGLMKDMPALLCALLAARNTTLLASVFPVCIDNGKMLRNFVQIVRSGVTGRKSFGNAVKRLIRKWFEQRTDEQLFHASIGEKPSFGDIIKMVHPRPKREARRMMFAYLIGREVAAMGLLPEVVQQFEVFKRAMAPAADGSKVLSAGDLPPLPDINFQFLLSLPLTPAQWGQVCDRASWQTLRMNLNTFARHGCFTDMERVARVCKRLQDPVEISKAKPMPYQLFTAFLNVGSEVPAGIKLALAQAAEIALSNIPELPAYTVVGVDVSGSMRSVITGDRGSTSSTMRCVDVAALIACAILRKNPTAQIVAFDTELHEVQLAGSIVDSANKLATYGGGGTNCALPVSYAASLPRCDAVVLISDNESWVDTTPGSMRGYGQRGTEMMAMWRVVQAKNKNPKLVCIDLTPNTSRQSANEACIANVGGFSDAVFDFMGTFLNEGRQWVEVINGISVDPVPVVRKPEASV